MRLAFLKVLKERLIVEQALTNLFKGNITVFVKLKVLYMNSGNSVAVVSKGSVNNSLLLCIIVSVEEVNRV
jgi:hypothetical protein